MGVLACRTVPAPPPPLPDVPPAPVDEHPPKVALVLGGGAARGFAHVGVIRVLEEERIPVEMIVGTSVGSMVGAFYAGTPNSYAVERLARALTRDDFFDFALWPALFGNGLATGNRLERFVRDRLGPKDISELRVPFAAVATDLETGEAVVIDRGPIARAVRASCAIPGVFEPVRHMGRLLVDGGVADNLPVRLARRLGADVVIAVGITALSAKAPTSSFVEVILRSVNIVAHDADVREGREADVLVEPDVGELGLIDFDQKQRAFDAGVAAARAALPAIRQALAAWRPARAAAGRGSQQR